MTIAPGTIGPEQPIVRLNERSDAAMRSGDRDLYRALMEEKAETRRVWLSLACSVETEAECRRLSYRERSDAREQIEAWHAAGVLRGLLPWRR